MGWNNPFSFEGRVGRGAFWLTLIVATLMQVALDRLPVSSRTWVLSTYGGFGESTISYATPLEPLTLRSYGFFAVYCLLTIATVWVLLAAMVKRLHDRGRSGKWVAGILLALVLDTAWEAAFSRPGMPLSAFDIVSMIFMVPICALGAWGLLEMFYFPGKYDDDSARRSFAA